jgi:transcriptional regulator with XRE-family HTH domain
MSSNLLHEFSSQLTVQRVNQFIVRNGREALGRFIEAERKERGWSYGEIARRSEGYIQSPSTVGNIVNGNVATVSEDTMLGLAKAFKVPAEKVRDVYYGKQKPKQATQERFAELALKFDRLPDNKKVNGEALIELLDRELDRLAAE